MRVIVCGPPHSGKSVMIAQLRNYLPADSYFIVRVHKDGEGTWSNNPDETMTKAVREKDSYDEAFIKKKCEEIKKIKSDIVIVDIGGKLLMDKIPIFQTCDSFIIISNNPGVQEAWKIFGERHGAKCIASLLSIEHGQEYLESRDGIIRGIMANLQRGKNLGRSKILDTISSVLLNKSGYIPKHFPDDSIINVPEITNRLYKAADNTKNFIFTPTMAPDIYSYFFSHGKNHKSTKIYGIRANWVSAIACQALADAGTENISIYDVTLSDYIPIVKKQTKSDAEFLYMKIYIEKSEKCVFIDIHSQKDTLTLFDLENLILPELDRKKELYISGRLPLWMSNTIAMSYENETKYLFQPGNYFICIDNKDKSKLGTLKESPDGIDLFQHFKKINSKS